MKSILIAGGFILFFFVLVMWWVFRPSPTTPQSEPITFIPNSLNNSSSETSSTKTSNPDVEVSTSTSQEKIIAITGRGGKSIQVNDPTEDPATSQDHYNPDYYYLGYHAPEEDFSDSTATTTPPYIIEYFASTNYFDVVLLREPIGDTRMEAEQYLIQHLGISESQMCELDYTVAVPHWVSEFYTATNLGFSFCPGATPLP